MSKIGFVLLTITALQLAFLPSAFAGALSDPAVYPLPTCGVCEKNLGAESAGVTLQHDGREVRFCGKECEQTFKKNSSHYMKILDQSIIDDQLPYYPLSTCLVSGEALGGNMGEPANYLHGNRLVRFCCIGCLSGFNKSAEKYIEKLDEAVIEAQLEGYPADACPVTGEKLGGMGDPYNHVFAGRLVRFCCKGCIGGFNSNPTAAMAVVYGDHKATH